MTRGSENHRSPRVRNQGDIPRDLEERVVAGDRWAFDSFHAIAAPRLLRFVRARVASAAEADEVSQEVWIRFLGALPRFEHRARLWSFLLSIARRTVIDHYRRSSCRPSASTSEDAALSLRSHGPSVARTAHHRQVIERAMRRPDSIGEEAWEALWLHDVDGRSMEDIAVRQSIPKGTAGTRVFYARRRLRDALERAGNLPDDSPPTVGCCG